MRKYLSFFSTLLDLYEYNGYCSLTPGGPYTLAGNKVAAAPQPPLLSTESMVINNCVTTEYGDAYVVVTAVSVTGRESTYSNEVKKSFFAPVTTPAAPSNLRE